MRLHLIYLIHQMCSNPLILPRNSSIIRDSQIRRTYRRIGEPFRDFIEVPCGKCIECLKRRQNDLAVRVQREATKRGSMCFLTLTYRDDVLPLACRLQCINKDTGEVYYPYPASPLVRCEDESSDTAEFVKVCRGLLAGLPIGPTARVVEYPWFEDDEYEYRFTVTPSLYRRDVRLWLKRCRVRYQREKGTPLPDFSYVAVGELGPRTARPHYHLAFMGLTVEQVQWLASQWSFGFWNLKKVNAVNNDGTSGFEIAARYIGKYMSKGVFDCDSVKDGLCEKPRLMLSTHLGTDLPENLVAYFRCYDLFGKYNLNSLTDPHTHETYTKERLIEMYTEIKKRAHLCIGGVDYALPKAIIVKLWYTYDSIRKVFVASDFRTACQAATYRDDLSDYIRELRAHHPGISRGALADMVNEFLAFQDSCSENRERAQENYLRTFYNNSIF